VPPAIDCAGSSGLVTPRPACGSRHELHQPLGAGAARRARVEARLLLDHRAHEIGIDAVLRGSGVDLVAVRLGGPAVAGEGVGAAGTGAEVACASVAAKVGAAGCAAVAAGAAVTGTGAGAVMVVELVRCARARTRCSRDAAPG